MHILTKDEIRVIKQLFQKVKVTSKSMIKQLEKYEKAPFYIGGYSNERYIHTFANYSHIKKEFHESSSYNFQGSPEKENLRNAILSQNLGFFSSTVLKRERIYVEGEYNKESKIFTARQNKYIVELYVQDNTFFIGEKKGSGVYYGMVIETNGFILLNKGIVATREKGKRIFMYVPPAPEVKKEGLFRRIFHKPSITYFKKKHLSSGENACEISYNIDLKQVSREYLPKNSGNLEAGENIRDFTQERNMGRQVLTSPSVLSSPTVEAERNEVNNSRPSYTISAARFRIHR